MRKKMKKKRKAMFLKKGVLHLIVIFTAVFAVTHIMGVSTPLAAEPGTVTVFAAASTTRCASSHGSITIASLVASDPTI